MEHQEAIDTHAAEGYLLGDLTAAEHVAFEEHFADCDICFADVRDGASMYVAMRAEPKPVVQRDYWKLIPAIAAAACFACTLPIIGYQHYQLTKLSQPRFVPAQFVSDSRAEEKPIVFNGSDGTSLTFDIPPGSAPVTCKVVDAKGKQRLASTFTADEVNLNVPADAFSPGHYSLIVTGTGGVSVLNKGFTVQ